MLIFKCHHTVIGRFPDKKILKPVVEPCSVFAEEGILLLCVKAISHGRSAVVPGEPVCPDELRITLRAYSLFRVRFLRCF